MLNDKQMLLAIVFAYVTVLMVSASAITPNSYASKHTKGKFSHSYPTQEKILRRALIFTMHEGADYHIISEILRD